jgi:hypothetical protein
MTAQAVDLTVGRYHTLPSGRKRPFFVTSLHSIAPKRSEMTAQLVSHSRQAVANDRLKKTFICPFNKKLENWNFIFTLKSIPCKFQRNPSKKVVAA